jgi:hypothetical protein
MPHRYEGHRDAGPDHHAIVPVVGLRGDPRVVGAHDGVVAERGDDARTIGGREPRQGRDVEVVVVIMRDQHRVDCRQRTEGDARIVDALGPGEAERRGALRPHRVDQQIEAGGLEQQGGVADVRDAPGRARNARRRPVGKRARRPRRPLGLRRAGPPAEHVEDALRRRAVRVEEVRPVEMVRHRPVVVTGERRARRPAGRAGGGEPGNGRNGAAAGEFHGPTVRNLLGLRVAKALSIIS